MSSSFQSLVKKHRHRVGVGYFVLGLLTGFVLCFLCIVPFRGGGSQESSSLSYSGVDKKRHLSSSHGTGGDGSSCVPNACQIENGWNLIHVFYGQPDHLIHYSTISKKHYDSVQWYSQARQDEMVATLLRNKRNGYFVDLAANDAIKISNTYALEKNFDWTGLCLEPNSEYWAGLSYRKNCRTVAAVVGDVRMKEISFRFPNAKAPKGGIVGLDNQGEQPIYDKPHSMVPLLEILQRFEAPVVMDYLSLDVEGAEDLILKSFPFDKYRFHIITVERPSKDVNLLLETNGYKFHRILKKNSGDTLYYHKSVESELDIEAADQIDTMKVYAEHSRKPRTTQS